MNTSTDSSLLQRALAALQAEDPEASVEVEPEGGALRVHSILESSTVLALLQAAALPVAAAEEPQRSDCCGGCCGG